MQGTLCDHFAEPQDVKLAATDVGTTITITTVHFAHSLSETSIKLHKHKLRTQILVLCWPLSQSLE